MSTLGDSRLGADARGMKTVLEWLVVAVCSGLLHPFGTLDRRLSLGLRSVIDSSSVCHVFMPAGVDFRGEDLSKAKFTRIVSTEHSADSARKGTSDHRPGQVLHARQMRHFPQRTGGVTVGLTARGSRHDGETSSVNCIQFRSCFGKRNFSNCTLDSDRTHACESSARDTSHLPPSKLMHRSGPPLASGSAP